MQIGERIVKWFQTHGRDLDWRESQDPYHIWVSEIIFQQTRIKQGAEYFYRFMDRFPNVFELAKADQDEVLKYWEGLGYYSRARNLHFTAKYVVQELDGKFPEDYQSLMKLKGIGPYTARAIGSFAFGNQVGVLDGNVLRVVSRLTGDFSPINDLKARKVYQATVDHWVQPVSSRWFNYGMMDLGASVCTPTRPGCLICPVQETCIAYREGLIPHLPQKKKTLVRKVRYFNFLLVRDSSGSIAIRKRPDKVFWGGLWEIPNVEISQNDWMDVSCPPGGEKGIKLKHVFTHFDMMIRVCLMERKDFEGSAECEFITSDKIRNFAFSRAVLKIFEAYFGTDEVKGS
ncbi:MAG: A/G-specific adenine glycosylase [Bacteroidota bacterium]